jgi:hypothetical protein
MNTEAIESRAHAALKYLTDTDELAADLKTDVERALQLYKATANAHFLAITGSVEERKRASEREAEPLYVDYLEAMRKYEAVANKRRSEAMAVEWCRSLYSNYRQGK